MLVRESTNDEEEAENMVSETTIGTTTTQATNEQDKDNINALVLGDDWFGSTPNTIAYQKMIDMARLTAELAYEQNNHAMVGALAEAGGDEGAAERWLLGFLTLMQSHLPHWWWWGEKTNHHDCHRNALLALANDRRGDYFIKRCIDPKVLKERMGAADFAVAKTVALEVLRNVTTTTTSVSSSQWNTDNDDEEEGFYADDDNKQFLHLSQDAIECAKAIWGQETMAELNKKSQQDIEKERRMEYEDRQKQEMLEEGEWWGPATHEVPDEAYQRLIDAARHGSMLAYEQGMRLVGAVADVALAGQGDETATTTDDTMYNPKELGPNAKSHFEQFLEEMNREELMPPWWDEEHEAALWQLAGDTEGTHFLGYPVNGDTLEELYDDHGVRHKIVMLAEAAAAEMDDPEEQQLVGDMDALKGIEGMDQDNDGTK